jgi:hypothetical protein
MAAISDSQNRIMASTKVARKLRVIAITARPPAFMRDLKALI